MKDTASEIISDRSAPVLKFYIIIFGIISGFLIGERLIIEYVLTQPLTFFEEMIPSSLLYVGFLGFTLLYARKTQTTFSEIGFHSLYVPKSLVVGFIATSGYLIVALATLSPSNYSGFDVFTVGCFALLIGVTEETMFRGYIQANYLATVSQIKAVLLTGMLFALLHIPSYLISGAFLNVLGLPSLILIGLLLGFTRIYTGNIYGVILVHTTWNYYLFLFSPVVTTETEISEMIIPLVASLAMWGTLVLAMLIAKRWIDRPAQIPAELSREYSFKIQSLLKKVWSLQQAPSYLYLPMRNIYSTRIKTCEDNIEILKESIPEINEFTYKVIQQLVPLKMKMAKVQNLLIITDFPPKRALYERRKAYLAQMLQPLADELHQKKSFNT